MKILSKKLIDVMGLLTMVGILCMPVFFTEAKFSNTRSSLKIDCVVEKIDVENGTLIVSASGTSHITVEINDRTRFSKIDSLNDLNSGDQIYIRAKIRDGKNPLARKIKKWGDEGYGYGYNNSRIIIYGTAGDRVKITEGEVMYSACNFFVVQTNVAWVIFKITEDTKFRNGNANNLYNKKVKVRGIDNGTEFVATKVRIK